MLIVLAGVYLLASLISIPGSITSARCRAHTMSGAYAALILAASLLCIVVLFLYMSSIGHVSAALVLSIPIAVAFVVGIWVGISETSDKKRAKKNKETVDLASAIADAVRRGDAQ